MGHPASAGIDEQQIPSRNDRKKGKGKSNDWLDFVVSHPGRKERVQDGAPGIGGD